LKEQPMPVLDDWKLNITVDDVLAAQGGDPEIMRKRSPRVLALAEWALQEGLALVKPAVLYERHKVESFSHQKLNLVGGGFLKGELIAEMLAPAEEVIACVVTIGKDLEKKVSELMPDRMDNAYTLDCFGSAAVDFLTVETCNYFETEIKKSGSDISSAISPGNTKWKIEDGQPQLFNLINSKEIQVELTPSMLMLPRKSTSFVMGVGKNLTKHGRRCDFCNLQDTCIYQRRWKS
jgi:hypothetical protein